MPQGQLGMENRHGQARRCPDRSLPPEIYVSLVNALYNDFRSLFVGTIAASGTALITAYKSGEPLLYLCSLAIALVACARELDVGRYQKRRAGIVSIDEVANGSAAMWPAPPRTSCCSACGVSLPSSRPPIRLCRRSASP